MHYKDKPKPPYQLVVDPKEPAQSDRIVYVCVQPSDNNVNGWKVNWTFNVICKSMEKV